MFNLFKSAGKSIGESAANSALSTFMRTLNDSGIYIAHADEIKPECLAEVKRRNLAARPKPPSTSDGVDP